MVKHRDEEEEPVEEEEEDFQESPEDEEDEDEEEEDYGPKKKKKGKPAAKKEEPKAPRERKKKGKAEEAKEPAAPEEEETKAPVKRRRGKAAEADAEPTPAPAKKAAKEPAAKPPPKEKRVTKRESAKAKEESVLKKYEDEETKAATFDDVVAFVDENLGNESAMNSFKNLLKKTQGTRELTRKVIVLLFMKAKDNQSLLPWVEEMVHATQLALMEPKKILHDPMFFPNIESEAKVVNYLSQAKTTLEICVFSITYNVLGDAIIAAHNRGAKVRVISDDEMAKTPGSDIERFVKLGIPTKIDLDPKAHMHNKFAIIDKQILLTGSFNWTKQAALKNNENFLATNDEFLIEKYGEEFERLWEKFIVPGEKPPAVEKAPEALQKVAEAPQKPAEGEVDADNMLSG